MEKIKIIPLIAMPCVMMFGILIAYKMHWDFASYQLYIIAMSFNILFIYIYMLYIDIVRRLTRPAVRTPYGKALTD
jgi:hypothetical protein